jgi:hypothetical protein
MSTWDAARLASLRPLHKPVSRIGHDPTISDLTPRQKSGASGGYSPSDKACQRCGYHVCSRRSCRLEPKISNVSKPLPGLVV